MRKFLAMIALLVPLTSMAETDFKDLLFKAMRAPSGTTRSEVTGPVADGIRARINKPNAKILAEVTTVATLAQKGCKRFNIQITTPGTLLPMADGKSRPLDMSLKLNMCENGFPPGVDDEEQLNAEAAKVEMEATKRGADGIKPK